VPALPPSASVPPVRSPPLPPVTVPPLPAAPPVLPAQSGSSAQAGWQTLSASHETPPPLPTVPALPPPAPVPPVRSPPLPPVTVPLLPAAPPVLPAQSGSFGQAGWQTLSASHETPPPLPTVPPLPPEAAGLPSSSPPHATATHTVALNTNAESIRLVFITSPSAVCPARVYSWRTAAAMTAQLPAVSQSLSSTWPAQACSRARSESPGLPTTPLVPPSSLPRRQAGQALRCCGLVSLDCHAGGSYARD
jgi:hypothetical protein